MRIAIARGFAVALLMFFIDMHMNMNSGALIVMDSWSGS